MSSTSIKVLNYTPYKGAKVRLLDSMGSDLDIVNSARISFDLEKKEMDLADEKLIHFLMKHKHGTPFEAVEFHFHIECPITVMRELHRHRMSSFNEVSGRYVKMELDAYIPDKDAVRSQEGKAGSYTYKTIEDSTKANYVCETMKKLYDNCFDVYEDLLEKGVAKELARNVLPLGLISKTRYKTNARSLMNFLSLRNSERAMWEIRKIAECIEEFFAGVLPITHQAFIKNHRVAP